MVTFDGVEIFGTGAYHLVVLERGVMLVPRLRFGVLSSGSLVAGEIELTAVVRGRLVHDKLTDLWAAVSGIEALLTNPPTMGVLSDGLGQVLTDMSFVSFRTEQRLERGRLIALPFEATFVRIQTI
jgi:hypothetical protein